MLSTFAWQLYGTTRLGLELPGSQHVARVAPSAVELNKLDAIA